MTTRDPYPAIAAALNRVPWGAGVNWVAYVRHSGSRHGGNWMAFDSLAAPRSKTFKESHKGKLMAYRRWLIKLLRDEREVPAGLKHNVYWLKIPKYPGLWQNSLYRVSHIDGATHVEWIGETK